jgi:hypothetical protein
MLRRRKLKSSSKIPRRRHRKSKSFPSRPIRPSSGSAAVGNGVDAGFGRVDIGDRVRIRALFGCAADGFIAVTDASGLKAIGVEKINLEISRPPAFETPVAFFSSARQYSFGFSGQTDLMPEKVN